jgi:hypothetical protein
MWFVVLIVNANSTTVLEILAYSRHREISWAADEEILNKIQKNRSTPYSLKNPLGTV